MSLVAKVMKELRTQEGAPRELLDKIAAVLTELRGIANSESSIAAALKASPEVAAGILGAFLTVCRRIIGSGARVEAVWVNAMVDLWRGSIWGSVNAKEVCALGLLGYWVVGLTVNGRRRHCGRRNAWRFRRRCW